MDLTYLTSQIQKNPQIYHQEYQSILNKYTGLSKLPKTSSAQILPLIVFLTSTCPFYDSNYAEILSNHIQTTSDQKLKKELLTHLAILRNKNQITDYKYFKIIIEYGNLQKMVGQIQINNFDKNLLTLFENYKFNGNDKQATFSFFMLCMLYEKGFINEIDLMLNNEKLKKIFILYVLNELEFCKNEKSRILKEMGEYIAKSVISSTYKEIQMKGIKREEKIKRLQFISTLRNEYNIEFDICRFLIKIMDLNKEDLEQIMEILVDNVWTNKTYNSNCVDDGGDETYIYSINYEIIDEIINMFCTEYKDDDFIVYGLNFLKKLCLKYKIDEYILEKINIFNKHKNSSINVAFRGVIKALKNKENDDRGILHVKRKLTKEERKELKKVDRNKFKAKNRKKDSKKKTNKRIPGKKKR